MRLRTGYYAENNPPFNIIDKDLAKKDKVSGWAVGGNAFGHLMTAKSVMDGVGKDKQYAQELAARGIKDNRNWFQRNAKALTSTAGGALGNILGDYIQRKTGTKKFKGTKGFLVNGAIGAVTSKIGSSLVDKPIDAMRQKKLDKFDKQYGHPQERMHSEHEDEKKKGPNWFQRNKKLLIGAGITAGLGVGGYYLGRHVLADKINKGGFIKDKIDKKSIAKYLDEKGVHKWNKGMTKENYKNLHGQATDFLKKQNPEYLKNRVREKMGGYGVAAGVGLGAAGALSLARPSRPHYNEEETRSQAKWQDRLTHVGNGFKLGMGGQIGNLSGFIADKIVESIDKDKRKEQA